MPGPRHFWRVRHARLETLARAALDAVSALRHARLVVAYAAALGLAATVADVGVGAGTVLAFTALVLAGGCVQALGELVRGRAPAGFTLVADAPFALTVMVSAALAWAAHAGPPVVSAAAAVALALSPAPEALAVLRPWTVSQWWAASRRFIARHAAPWLAVAGLSLGVVACASCAGHAVLLAPAVFFVAAFRAFAFARLAGGRGSR